MVRYSFVCDLTEVSVRIDYQAKAALALTIRKMPLTSAEI